MSKLGYILVLVGLTLLACKKFDSTIPLITRELIEEIRKTATFETYDYDNHPFKDFSLDQLRQQYGVTLSSHDPLYKGTDMKIYETQGLPTYYNSRKAYPNCARPIRDQGNCGACWAFSSTSVLADRFCIKSQGSINIDFSVQDLVSCDTGDNACKGGTMVPTWQYLALKGVVSAGCWSYKSYYKNVPLCPTWTPYCEDGTPYKKYFAKNYIRFPKVSDVMTEIMVNGPVQGGFMTYLDFSSYKGGVYVRSREPWNQETGGHAIKIIGWGFEAGFNYWIVENSYGPTWGEQGTFRIRFGECGIENDIIAGDPKI